MNDRYVTCPVCGKRNCLVTKRGKISQHLEANSDRLSPTTSGGVSTHRGIYGFKCRASGKSLSEFLPTVDDVNN